MTMTRLLVTALIISFSPILPAFAQDNDTIVYDILRSYKRGLGDFIEVRNIRSFRVKGSTFQQEESYDFTLYKKSPNLMRYEIDHQAGDIVQIFDGKSGWQWLADEGASSLKELTGAQLEFLKKEALFDTPLMRYSKEGKELAFIGRKTIPSNLYPVYHLQLTSPDDEAVEDIYLDSRTYYEVRRVCRESKDAPAFETVFTDYRKVKGFPVPYDVSNYVDGEFLSSTKLDEVVINVGILSFYFDKPKK